jgi:hypothetical protein
MPSGTESGVTMTGPSRPAPAGADQSPQRSATRSAPTTAPRWMRTLMKMRSYGASGQLVGTRSARLESWRLSELRSTFVDGQVALVDRQEGLLLLLGEPRIGSDGGPGAAGVAFRTVSRVLVEQTGLGQ